VALLTQATQPGAHEQRRQAESLQEQVLGPPHVRRFDALTLPLAPTARQRRQPESRQRPVASALAPPASAGVERRSHSRPVSRRAAQPSGWAVGSWACGHVSRLRPLTCGQTSASPTRRAIGKPINTPRSLEQGDGAACAHCGLPCSLRPTLRCHDEHGLLTRRAPRHDHAPPLGERCADCAHGHGRMFGSCMSTCARINITSFRRRCRLLHASQPRPCRVRHPIGAAQTRASAGTDRRTLFRSMRSPPDRAGWSACSLGFAAAPFDAAVSPQRAWRCDLAPCHWYVDVHSGCATWRCELQRVAGEQRHIRHVCSHGTAASHHLGVKWALSGA
jgi:hypothetical protein